MFLMSKALISKELPEIEVISISPEQTQHIGEIIGSKACPGDVVLLTGDLGAGKTCLTQGILWGLGLDEYARRPTFVLVAEYQGRLPLYHMDLYRLDDAEGIEDLGIDDYLFGDGISVIEWADKAVDFFPPGCLKIDIEYVDDSTRKLSIRSPNTRYAKIMSQIESDQFKG